LKTGWPGATREHGTDFGAWGDGAAGLEIDAYDARLGSPPHALVVASSENHSNAFLLVNEEMLSNFRGIDGTLNARVKADIVFFETAQGGAVLATIMGEQLFVGGDIILKVQGIRVGEFTDHRRVRDLMGSVPPGGEFTMTVLRLGQVIELKGRHP